MLTLVAALAAGAGPAAADPAQVSTSSGCFSNFGSTFCFSTRVVSKLTLAPSGGEQFFGHVTSSYTTTGPGDYRDSGETRSSIRYVFKDGVAQFSGSNEKGSYTVPGYTCTYRSVFRYVNGEVRVEFYDNQCTPTT